jgi:hypothetical protein
VGITAVTNDFDAHHPVGRIGKVANHIAFDWLSKRGPTRMAFEFFTGIE